MTKYLYQVVSGYSVWGQPWRSQPHARQKATELALRNHFPGTLEVERILELPGGGRRYWRLEGKRWTTDWNAPIEERKPAWVAKAQP